MKTMGLGCSSGVEHVPIILESLGFMPSKKEKEKRKGEKYMNKEGWEIQLSVDCVPGI